MARNRVDELCVLSIFMFNVTSCVCLFKCKKDRWLGNLLKKIEYHPKHSNSHLMKEKSFEFQINQIPVFSQFYECAYHCQTNQPITSFQPKFRGHTIQNSPLKFHTRSACDTKWYICWFFFQQQQRQQERNVKYWLQNTANIICILFHAFETFCS